MKSYWKIFVLILAAVLFVACSDSNDDSSSLHPNGNIDVEAGKNLVGKVLDGASPIVGAVVSDGYTTALTNDKGVYQLTANAAARFVFVSVPADCQVPIERGVPKIYEKLEKPADNKVQRKDFGLKKGTKETSFTLVALADVQIQDDTDLGTLKNDMPVIKEHIATLSTPVYAISLGDLVWDKMSLFSSYRDQMNRLGIPMFHIVGNHDHDMNIQNDDAESTVSFEHYFGPTYYSYNRGDVHFVMLDDVYYTGGLEKEYVGLITQNQLDWLREDLKHVDKDKLIILNTHIPTIRRNTSTAVSNRQDLYDILKGYKVRILSGHTHYNFTTTINDDIEENTLGAVSGAFWTGDLCPDGSPRGFGVYEIDGNKIKNWYYKGIHHDADYQMVIYPPGKAVSSKYKSDVMLNLFNWHTTWTVSVSVDGAADQALTNNIKEYDKAAYEYMYGEKKPSRRSWVEPEISNDHMFNYTVPATWSKVEIKAQDPYGNLYQGAINKGK